MNPLERTESSKTCRRCGGQHWQTGEKCSDCIRDDFIGGRVVAGTIIGALIGLAIGAVMVVRCFGADNFPSRTDAAGILYTVDRSAHRPPNAGRPAGENVRLDRMHQPVKSDRVFSVVNDTILDAIAWRESRNNPRAVGKRGELGAYQIRAIAVREVNRVHGTRYRHSDAVAQGREIARRYLLITEAGLARILRRPPTSDELYQGYRYGLTGYSKRFRTGHVREAVPGASRVERSYAAKISTGPGCGADFPVKTPTKHTWTTDKSQWFATRQTGLTAGLVTTTLNPLGTMLRRGSSNPQLLASSSAARTPKPSRARSTMLGWLRRVPTAGLMER